MVAPFRLSREFRELAEFLLEDHGESANLGQATEILEKEKTGISSDGLDSETAESVLIEIQALPRSVSHLTLLRHLLDQDSRAAALEGKIVDRQERTQWAIVNNGLYLTMIALIFLIAFAVFFHLFLVINVSISVNPSQFGPVPELRLALGFLFLSLLVSIVCVGVAQGKCRNSPRISGMERMAGAYWLIFFWSPIIPIVIGMTTYMGMELKDHQKGAAIADVVTLSVILWAGILCVAEVFFLIALCRLAHFFGRARLAFVVTSFLVFFVLFSAGTLAYAVLVPPPKPASTPEPWGNNLEKPKRDTTADVIFSVVYMVFVPAASLVYLGIIKKSHDLVGYALLSSEDFDYLETSD